MTKSRIFLLGSSISSDTDHPDEIMTGALKTFGIKDFTFNPIPTELSIPTDYDQVSGPPQTPFAALGKW